MKTPNHTTLGLLSLAAFAFSNAWGPPNALAAPLPTSLPGVEEGLAPKQRQRPRVITANLATDRQEPFLPKTEGTKFWQATEVKWRAKTGFTNVTHHPGRLNFDVLKWRHDGGPHSTTETKKVRGGVAVSHIRTTARSSPDGSTLMSGFTKIENLLGGTASTPSR